MTDKQISPRLLESVKRAQPNDPRLPYRYLCFSGVGLEEREESSIGRYVWTLPSAD